MAGLIGSNLLQVLVEGVGEAGSDELGLGVVLETLAVEGVLEVLEGERVVEDDTWVLLAGVSVFSCGTTDHR